MLQVVVIGDEYRSTLYNTIQYNTIQHSFIRTWQNASSTIRVVAMPKASTHLYTTCVWWMRSQLSVWCVQAVPVSGCGVADYRSVMRWMVVVMVCVGRDVIVWQFYWIVLRRRCHTVHQMSAGPVDSIRGAGRGLTHTLMRCRSDALLRPRHALAAYVRRATTLESFA